MIEPGTVVEIIVQGVHGGSQGVASVPVFFTMPLEAAVAGSELEEEKPAPTRYGHAARPGNTGRNGNGNGPLARAVRETA